MKRWGLLGVVAASLALLASACTPSEVNAFIASHTCTIGSHKYITYETHSNPGDPVCEDVTSPGSERFSACFQDKTYTFAELSGEPDFADLQAVAAGNGYTVSRGACSASRAPQPDISHALLCYSKWQVNPETSDGWFGDVAAALLASGYWQPYAIPGASDDPDAVNIGGIGGNPAYHLQCNLSGTQKPTGEYVDGDGDPLTMADPTQVGAYQVAG